MMDSRGRVIAAINCKRSDRVPLDLGGWVTSMLKIAYENLLNYLQKGGKEPERFPSRYKLKDWIQQLPNIDESVLRQLGIDTGYIRPSNTEGEDWALDEWEEEVYYYVTDGWGVTRKRPKDGVLYYDIVLSECPLKDADMKDLNSYDWPDPEDPCFLEGIKKKAKEIIEVGYNVVADFNFESRYENCWYMRGYESFYKDMYKNPEFVDTLLEKVSD